MAGGAVAGIMLGTIDGVDFAAVQLPAETSSLGLWVEFIYTFILVTVVCNVAATTAPGYKNNSFFGLAIGFVIVVAAQGGGGYSGGAYNPAVMMGVNFGNYVFGNSGGKGAIISAQSYSILFAELAGGAAAGAFFAWTDSAEEEAPKSSRPSKRSKVASESTEAVAETEAEAE